MADLLSLVCALTHPILNGAFLAILNNSASVTEEEFVHGRAVKNDFVVRTHGRLSIMAFCKFLTVLRCN